MVMVHAAATWGPPPSTQPPALVYVVSGMGGLAAPLFVTVFGWGCFHGRSTTKQRLYRTAFFVIAQTGVNASSPHLFDLWTPGVLTLFGFLTITQPLWLHPLRQRSHQTMVSILLSTFFLTAFFPSIQGYSGWDVRIETTSALQWISHVCLTGTYPLFPWILFAVFGAWIAGNGGEHATFPKTNASKAMLGGAFSCTAATLAYANLGGLEWAAPTGDSVLTFFPANTPFLIAALLGVAFLWMLIERYSVSSLGLLGRRSLTVYLVHFIPIGIFHSVDEAQSFTFAQSMIVVLAYTCVWWPAAHAWDRLAPRMNVEQLFRAMSKD
jgi:surface polysaccharide O-acyltransferase-like enzyme